MATPSAPQYPFSLDYTIGAVVNSAFCSVFAMGVVAATGYVYFLSFPKDRLGFKLLAGSVLLLALFDTMLNSYWCYDFAVTFWGNPIVLAKIPLGFMIQMIVAATVTSIVQCFFAWRLWLISMGSLIVVVPIVAASIVQWSVVVWVIAYWTRHRLFTEVGGVLPTAYAWLVASVVADALITGWMVYFLKAKATFKPDNTSTSLSSIISRTVQANVLSLVNQVLTFILFKADIGMYFFLNDVLVSKIYAFSLLVSLNARRSSTALFNLSGSQTRSKSAPTGSNIISLAQFAKGDQQSQAGSQGIRVQEDVSVHTDSDDAWNAKRSQIVPPV
ncbi:hypothetical protein AURDEDRAFT_160148 [Auricularia subglabra TFB-10046 SS5]|nr:hypothetical protein AURDEDRAFT_160148 [Auricularia subglabra TFB-10046 SS5]